MKGCPPTITASSSPLQTRLDRPSISSGTGKPSAEPETIDHSPCNWAMSFFTASFSAAHADEIVAAASPIRDAIRIVLMVVFGCSDVLLQLTARTDLTG